MNVCDINNTNNNDDDDDDGNDNNDVDPTTTFVCLHFVFTELECNLVVSQSGLGKENGNQASPRGLTKAMLS